MLATLAQIDPTPDATDQGAHVATAVRRHCLRHGYDASTTTGAIAWALKAPGSTLQQVAAGNRRADQLHDRAKPAPVHA
jgi:hypothetical protein